MELWGGHFKSSSYISGMVNGTLSVSLPQNMNQHSPGGTPSSLGSLSETTSSGSIETVAIMTYRGIYRYGAVTQLPIKYEGDQSGVTQQENAGVFSNNFTFKGFLGQQVICFDLENITDNEITGTYTTVNPNDNGTFTLTKGLNVSTETGCVIM